MRVHALLFAVIAFQLSVSGVTAQSPVGHVSQAPSQSAATGLVSAEHDAIVVTVFTNISGAVEDEWVGPGIAETIGTDLEGLTGMSVVGRELVADALARIDSTPGNNAESRELVVGRRLGARWVVSGAYQRLGDRVRITARVVEVATGAVVHTAIVDGTMTELFALQDQVTADLRRGLMDQETPATPTRSASAPNVGERKLAPTSARSDRVVLGRTTDVAPGTIVIDGAPAPVAPATLRRDAGGRATVRAVRLDDPLDVDGTLDESIYDTVPSLGGFVQQSPNEGAPATERTEAWVFYDDGNVYVSGRLWDSAPESEWIANEMQRDSPQLMNNDYFSLVLDPFYDRRNGLGFMANAIGGFFDGEFSEGGRPNNDWNPIWNVRTGRFDGGWTIEMQIPYKSIRFRPGASQIWGLQIGRNIRRKNENVYLNPVPIAGLRGEMRVSAGGTLVGIEVPAGNRTFEIKPYAIGSLATDVNATPRISNRSDGDFGVDVKYGVTQNLTADFTYNTDFNQVEVDEQQVNLTRFSLFFPEKREFFLEGRAIFDFGTAMPFAAGGGGGGPGGGTRRQAGGFGGGGGDVPTLFFSRRIGLEGGQTVPILAGGRLSGKAGPYSIGAVNIQTDDAPNVGAQATNFTVLRVKRDILRRSTIGAIFTGRSVSATGSGSNEVYGVDGAFSFYDNVNFNGYYARTKTQGRLGDDTSYQGVFSYNGDLYAVQVDHLLVGNNFNPEIGFLRRANFRRSFARAEYRPRPRAIEAVRQFTFGGSLDYIESGTGHLETRITQLRFNTEFENSDQFGVDVQDNYEWLVRPFRIASDATIPVGGYAFQDLFMSYAMGGQRRVSGTFTFQHGGFFGGHLTAVGYRRGRIELTPQLSVEPSISINRIDLPGGLFTTTLARSRVTYTLTPRIFFGGLLQYNDSTESLSMNLRLRWEYQPGSELFVVYNDQRDTSLRGMPLLQNRAFVVKFTRLFRF